jgi:hypothetical protein
MLGVTLFGIFLTPVFYYVIQRFGGGKRKARHEEMTQRAPEREEMAEALVE